ncbi:hypothetical protein OC846_002617 [Tilletia horrida]|uniref:Uncharacterized protein n=1 Tax=Tilletia horrida TaxID=155126 RepID=A0AAN6GQD8_9BASI|nr:hypothetical protein OC845_006506 [Tilletia horrida]KAK0553129.1 hypothetical protein OC846_002617 [Tilletia horrida]KAK0564712.1 hypothetical protein OC861_004129 [Tilletia horrida]
MKLTVASVLSLISAAAAATTGPYSIGAATSGYEIGVLNATILCNVSSTGLNLKNQVIGFGIKAALPNVVSSTQGFYVTAATRLIVPASINNLAYGFGARTYAGNATKVIVNAAGSSPSSIDAAKTPLAIPSAPVVSGGVSVLNVPASGSTIKVGPFKGASANSKITFSIGDIAATVKTYDSTGKATFLVANITCPAQARPASLAYVAVGGSGSTSTLTPATFSTIPTIPINSTAGTTGYTYSCTFTDLGTASVRVSLGGAKASNAAVASGGTISVTKGQGNIYSSAALVSLIQAKYASATKFSVKISTLTFTATGATPSSKNGIPSTGLTSAQQSVSSTAVATIPSGAPTTTLAAVTFTAGASGTTAFIGLGDAAGTLNLFDSTGASLAAIPFSCPAKSPNVPIFPYDIL